MLRFSMTVPIDAFSVWITGVSATTETTSLSWPISSVNGNRYALPTCTWMPERSIDWKPSSSPFNVYVPGGIAGKT